MGRRQLLLLVALGLIPSTASALDLRWNSGNTSLSFSEATRCTLVVHADSAEVLPAEWRLLSAADTLITYVPVDTLTACSTDTAQVRSVEGPQTEADSAENIITAHFCSAGEDRSTLAKYVMDLPAGSRGKFKVVALDPLDSTSVIESNVADFNGGVSDSFQTVALAASSTHNSLQLRVTVQGAGLARTGSMTLTGRNTGWELPLTIVERQDGAVTGVAQTAALLPQSEVRVVSEDGQFGTVPLDADPAPEDPLNGGCARSYWEELLPPPPSPNPYGYAVMPKDFAFVPGFVDTAQRAFELHLFYTRRHMYTGYLESGDQKEFGHTHTTDLRSWARADTESTTVRCRPGKFDADHVWAPSIVQSGGTFYMHYTGVRYEGSHQFQRIGLATSNDLLHWTQRDTAVFSANQIDWAGKSGAAFSNQVQLRDPFVMADPDSAGSWLMYYTAADTSFAVDQNVIGVARSTDLVNWTSPLPIRATEHATRFGRAQQLESPHVFRRSGRWWLFYTANPDHVFFITTTGSPTDTVQSHWTSPIYLRDVAEYQPAQLQYWHATEFLALTNREYLAAFNDNALCIDIMGLYPVGTTTDSFNLDCPEVAGAPDEAPSEWRGLRVVRQDWRSGEVVLGMEVPRRMPVSLTVYDVAGRRVATLLEREVGAGKLEVPWKGSGRGGVRVSSGIYFVRCTYPGGASTARVVVVR
jgi:hypothetical protein